MKSKERNRKESNISKDEPSSKSDRIVENSVNPNFASTSLRDKEPVDETSGDVGQTLDQLGEEEDEEEEEDNSEGDVALSEIETDSDPDELDDHPEDVDIITYQKLSKDNHPALKQALSTFAIPFPSLPFYEHQSLTTLEPVQIDDVNDDLSRELAFYKQGIETAKEGRILLLKEGIPFSRPLDYFAEMVKNDEHMDKVRDHIVADEASKKASEAARKQRDLKKFGKQVQVAKLQERQKEKKTTLEKIKTLKRKRRDTNTLTTEDDFDVELERSSDPSKKPKMSRDKRYERYGLGGKGKRTAKKNDDDVADISGFSGKRGGVMGRKKGKGGQRPGKRRRMQQRK